MGFVIGSFGLILNYHTWHLHVGLLSFEMNVVLFLLWIQKWAVKSCNWITETMSIHFQLTTAMWAIIMKVPNNSESYTRACE